MKNHLDKMESPDRRAFVSYLARSFLGVTAASLTGCGKNGKGVAVVDQANIAADGAGELVLPANRPTAKSVIYLYMGGGMTHVDTLDPKDDKEVMMNTSPIATNVDGIRLGHWFEKTAKHMDKAVVINSMNTTQGAHGPGNYFMHTSYTQRASITHPTMGSWVGRLSGPMNPDLPASVFIGADSVGGGAGFFPSRFGALGIGDPEAGLKNSARPKGVDEREFKRRLELASFLDTEFHNQYEIKEVQAYTDAYTDALRLMSSEDLKGFSIEAEPESMHTLYGESKFGKGCLLARRLVEHGVRFIEVRSGGWDMHGNIWENLPEKMADLDQGLSALLADLELRGLLDETLVVLASEFGRSPSLSSQGGRNHHPRVFSTLLAGGGIQGGQLYGKSDKRAFAVAENKVSVPDFNATIAYAMGLPYNEIVYSPSKRPFTVADNGTPLVELFG